MEKTTKDGLLDSPAIALSVYQYDYLPIFNTEAEGGMMLVTENPDYIRKELPKYMPQMLVLSWTWSASSPAQQNARKIIEADFSIEKLQAMIDKQINCDEKTNHHPSTDPYNCIAFICAGQALQ